MNWLISLLVQTNMVELDQFGQYLFGKWRELVLYLCRFAVSIGRLYSHESWIIFTRAHDASEVSSTIGCWADLEDDIALCSWNQLTSGVQVTIMSGTGEHTVTGTGNLRNRVRRRRKLLNKLPIRQYRRRHLKPCPNGATSNPSPLHVSDIKGFKGAIFHGCDTQQRGLWRNKVLINCLSSHDLSTGLQVYNYQTVSVVL
jgi:hypothetical protein